MAWMAHLSILDFLIIAFNGPFELGLKRPHPTVEKSVYFPETYWSLTIPLFIWCSLKHLSIIRKLPNVTTILLRIFFHRSSSNSLGSTASQKIQVMNWCSCHFKPKKSFLRKKPKKMMRKSENQVKPYEDMTLKMTLKSLTPPPSLQAQAVGSPTSSARHIYRWLVFDRAFWDLKARKLKIRMSDFRAGNCLT